MRFLSVKREKSLLVTTYRDSNFIPDEDKTGKMTVILSLIGTRIISMELVPVRNTYALIMDRRARHARSTFEVRAITDLTSRYQRVETQREKVWKSRGENKAIITATLIDRSCEQYLFRCTS
jgi:hypothetical protein